MAHYTVRPLTPEAKARLGTTRRVRSQFQSTLGSTLQLLGREVEMLGTREFVVMADCAESEIRIDGQLRANARLDTPDVAVAIESPSKGSLLFTCGRYIHWDCNLRAIALGLEALRKVERYGIVQSDEQYRGWKALPPGMAMPAARMTPDEAYEVLATAAQEVVPGMYSHADLYRMAVKLHHPDVGGDPEIFVELQKAKEVLGL